MRSVFATASSRLATTCQLAPLSLETATLRLVRHFVHPARLRVSSFVARQTREGCPP